MFAQSGLLDAVKPLFPGYGTLLTSAQVINSTTLRYLHLVKNNKIVHPQNPLLLRETEDGIEECRLVHVSDRDARNITEAHPIFLKKDYGVDLVSGETHELTVRKKRLLGEASRVYLKRKAAKSPSGSRGEKVAKTTTGARKPRKPKMLLLDATEEEKEKAEMEEALKKVANLKEKEERLKDTYDSGLNASDFEEMYSKLSPRDDPYTVAKQKIYTPVDNGKFPQYIVNGSVSTNVFQKSTYIQPPLVPVKRAYDIFFINVDPKKDNQKNLTLAEMRALRENQHLSKSFKPFQTKPSESKVNTISNVATASSSAPVIKSVHDAEDSEATPTSSPPPPPPKFVSLAGQIFLSLEPSPKKDQNKPSTPTPEVDQTKPSSPPPVAETLTSPEPEQQIQPNSELIQNTNSPVHVIEKSPHHVTMDNTFTAIISTNPHLQEFSRDLDLDLPNKTPPHASDLNNLMNNLSHDCIFVPPHLPYRILNEPISDTQEDITRLLQAVDKNIRRLNIDIPDISIDLAHIDKECDLMEVGLQNMMKAVREAYKKDLEFSKELARKEAERIEREKREAEEREKKRQEDERIEKERQEALAREQARLAEEARVAVEQARLAEFARNALEFAIQMREDQEELKKTVSEHSSLLTKMFATLQSIEARLPHPPQP
jgi:hypothetical protein